MHMDCHLPYASLAAAAHTPSHPQDDPQPTDNATTLPLEGLTEGPVWLVATTETPPNTLTKPLSPPPHSQWVTGTGEALVYIPVDSNTPPRLHADSVTPAFFCVYYFFYNWFLLSGFESLYSDVMYEKNVWIWDIAIEREERKWKPVEASLTNGSEGRWNIASFCWEMWLACFMPEYTWCFG